MAEIAHEAEGLMAMLSALLVLFTALLDPIYSAALAVVLLAGFAAYKLTRK